jgi:hypothetical protein
LRGSNEPHALERPRKQQSIREKLLLGSVVIGMMIVGAVFLYLITEGLLWLEGYFS